MVTELMTKAWVSPSKADLTKAPTLYRPVIAVHSAEAARKLGWSLPALGFSPSPPQRSHGHTFHLAAGGCCDLQPSRGRFLRRVHLCWCCMSTGFAGWFLWTENRGRGWSIWMAGQSHSWRRNLAGSLLSRSRHDALLWCSRRALISGQGSWEKPRRDQARLPVSLSSAVSFLGLSILHQSPVHCCLAADSGLYFCKKVPMPQETLLNTCLHFSLANLSPVGLIHRIPAQRLREV